MEEVTGFGMKNSLILPSLDIKYFKSLRNENGEPIYIYSDEFMRCIGRPSLKGGKSLALNQYYESIILDDVFKIISKELKINCNVCEILDKCLDDIKRNRNLLEDEYDSQFEDYRDMNADDKTKFVNDKFSKITVHNNLKKLDLNEIGMSFDTASLYRIAN